MAPARRRPPSRRGGSSSSSTPTLSRFKPESELCALNADPRERVPASELLRTAVAGRPRGGRAAASGLVDPTLVGEIESAGYVASRAGVPGRAARRRRSAEAPPRQPGRARTRRRAGADSRSTTRRGTIARPPGVRFDTGGTGKGLAADLIADRLRGYSRFIVDCGGDIRIGGADALVDPYEVFVEHPLTGERAYVLQARLGRASRPRASTCGSGATPTAATRITCSTRPPASRPGPG